MAQKQATVLVINKEISAVTNLPNYYSEEPDVFYIDTYSVCDCETKMPATFEPYLESNLIICNTCGRLIEEKDRYWLPKE